MNNYYIGIMSGTSLDGIDAVLSHISATGKTKVLIHTELEMDDSLRKIYFDLQSPSNNEIHNEALAANQLALHYHLAVQKTLKKAELKSSDIIAIGAHGQTIRHQPQMHDGFGYTLQSLNAALLAEISEIDVIADFRSRDIAAGGQGAPLVPAFHYAQFAGETPKAVLNIGGISNLSLLSTKNQEKVIGFDSGPGNALMDYWASRHLNKRFDENGSWAQSGKPIDALLKHMLNDSYFSLKPPKSTGRDLFNPSWLERQLQETQLESSKPEDIQATLLALCAQSIANDLKKYAPDTQELFICGGGIKNQALVESISELCPHISKNNLKSTSELGIDPQAMEAAAFSWLAWAHKTKQPANLPAATGAKGQRILGAHYPA
jgi:anhydro-N-acetylmuramic acid kinase